MLVILTFLAASILFSQVYCRTRADDHRTHVADIRLLKGAFLGDVAVVQDALAHANTGNVNAILTREIGEHFLKLGRAGVDFPVAPALHVAICGGTRRHLQVAHLLLMRGADPNLVYSSMFTPFPAIYYALGAFTAATNSHAAMLQKMMSAYPKKFDPAAVQRFVQKTGTPPPLHTAVMQNFLDGVYLLSTTSIHDVNEKDVQGLSALHVAAWLGDTNSILLLLHNDAAPDFLDPFHRSFFHYLACRGMFVTLHTLLFDDSSPLSLEMKLQLLSLKDFSGHSVLDIALLPPAQMRIVTEISHFLKLSNESVPEMQYDYIQESKGFTSPGRKRDTGGAYARKGAGTHWVGNCSNYTSRLNKKNIIPKIWNTVVTKEWSLLSEVDFKTNFFYPQRPVKLVGNFTANMKIWNYLERDIFLTRYGSLVLNVSDMNGVCADHDKEKCFMTVEEYFNNSRSQVNIDSKDDDSCAMASDADMEILPDTSCDVLGTHSRLGHMAFPVLGQSNILSIDMLLPQKFFSLCGLPGPLDRSMHLRMMASSYGVSPVRSESAMWNVLLVGDVRHWYLISPGVALNISTSTNNRRFHSNEGWEDWVQNIFPDLRKNRLAVEVVQRTGDVVFIPYSWSFVTSGQGDMIDFTHNFCVLPGNPSVFGQIPTGIRMYGHNTSYVYSH